jgi:orotate phosphoribosyltransferase
MSNYIAKDNLYYPNALISVNAFHFRINPPFISASGLKVPIYHDHRLLLSYPEVLKKIVQGMHKFVLESFSPPDVIVGIATGGIPYATLLADRLHRPLAYARPKPKDHGKERQIEGIVNKNSRILVVEDTLVTGSSFLKTYDSLKLLEPKSIELISLYTFGSEIIKEHMDRLQINYGSLYDLETLLKVARERNYLTSSQADFINNWRKHTNDFDWEVYRNNSKTGNLLSLLQEK